MHTSMGDTSHIITFTATFAHRCMIKQANTVRTHLSSLQKLFRFSDASSEHTGSKKDKDVVMMDMEQRSFERLEYTEWTLVLMDINGTLLHREWLGYQQAKCTRMSSRTHHIANRIYTQITREVHHSPTPSHFTLIGLRPCQDEAHGDHFLQWYIQ